MDSFTEIIIVDERYNGDGIHGRIVNSRPLIPEQKQNGINFEAFLFALPLFHHTDKNTYFLIDIILKTGRYKTLSKYHSYPDTESWTDVDFKKVQAE